MRSIIEAARARAHRDDQDGFTLIELMVVILIIAILLAIAIPTFLGARNSADDRAAQASLRNALTAAKTAYVNTQDYSGATATGLAAIEPSLTYTTAASTGPNNISVYVDTTDNNQGVELAALSHTGTCWYIADAATAAAASTLTGQNTPGTYYAHATGSCTTPAPTGTTWGSTF